MTLNDRKIAELLKKRLSEKIPIIDLRVFGSRARQDEDEYSDMDVFLEVESLDSDQKEALHDVTWEVGLENGVVISPLIFTREEVENSPLRVSPILVNIIREGVAI